MSSQESAAKSSDIAVAWENSLEKTVPHKSYHDPDFMIEYKGCRISYPFYSNIDNLDSFEPRPEDVCVVTFPKCGTTWASAIVHMIVHQDDPESLTSGAPIKIKVPYVEMTLPPKDPSDKPLTCIDYLKTLPGGRTYATHFNANAISHKILEMAKVVYVYRNPKDAVVSMYFFLRAGKMFQFKGDLDHVVQSIIEDKCFFAPFFEHLEGFWKRRNQPNIFVTSFEELVTTPRETIKKISDFLGKNVTESQLTNICHHCHFDQMKNNDLANMSDLEKPGWINRNISPFLRAGQIGNWKQHLTPEQNQRLDIWIAKNFAERPGLDGLKFQYE